MKTRNWLDSLILALCVIISLYYLYMIQNFQASQLVLFQRIISKVPQFSLYFSIEKATLLLFPIFVSCFRGHNIRNLIKVIASIAILLFVKNQFLVFCMPVILINEFSKTKTESMKKLMLSYFGILLFYINQIDLSYLFAILGILYIYKDQRDILMELVFLFFVSQYFKPNELIINFFIPLLSLVVLICLLSRKSNYTSSILILMLVLLGINFEYVCLFYVALNFTSNLKDLSKSEGVKFYRLALYVFALFLTRDYLEAQLLVGGLILLEVLNLKGQEYAK